MNPSIYEINTRVWIKRFGSEGKSSGVSSVPESYWESLADKGMNYIWLMGVWKICESTIRKYCLKEGAVKDSFKTALTDFHESDVIGSPFAVDRYDVYPGIGTIDEIISLRSVLNRLGMRLILDFIPNHFSADTSLIRTNPDIFLEVSEDFFQHDSLTFYKPQEKTNRFYAHGKDPYYPAWEDTIQVNYFNPDARRYMGELLLRLADICDGVRCDMAMLALNDIFGNTWSGVVQHMGYAAPKSEFWIDAIQAVKEKNPDFKFIAEVYWDLEWRLQQMGFDYTYDKTLLDRIHGNDIEGVRNHLKAETVYQKKSLRFIENHDEERAVTVFGEEKSMAAAVVASTLYGMRFYHDGQWEGKRIRLPVQLGREPVENVNSRIHRFYNKLLEITHHSVFKDGEWILLETYPAWDGDDTFQRVLAWLWRDGTEKRLVAVNLSESVSTCRVVLNFPDLPERFDLTDFLNDRSYERTAEEVANPGLYIELGGYGSHIFAF